MSWGGGGFKRTCEEPSNASCDVDHAGEHVGDEREEALDEAEDGVDDGVDDGVEGSEDGGDELVDGAEEVVDCSGDGHFGVFEVLCICVSQKFEILFSLEIGYLVIYFVLDSRTRDPKILYTPSFLPCVLYSRHSKWKREGSHRIVTSSWSHLEMDEACDVRLQPRDDFASQQSLLFVLRCRKKDPRAEEMLSRGVSYWFWCRMVPGGSHVLASGRRVIDDLDQRPKTHTHLHF